MKRQKNGIWKLTDDEMNEISIFAKEAARSFGNLYPGFSQSAKTLGDKIYKILDDAGVYDDINE